MNPVTSPCDGNSSEAGGGSRFGVERRDGFDEAGHGEGVAHAAGLANQVKPATLSSERNGQLHKGRNAGAVNLRDVVEIHDHLLGAFLQKLLGEVVEVLTRVANGEAAMNLKVVDAAGFARKDFQRWVERHEIPLSSTSTAADPVASGSTGGTCIIR